MRRRSEPLSENLHSVARRVPSFFLLPLPSCAAVLALLSVLLQCTMTRAKPGGATLSGTSSLRNVLKFARSCAPLCPVRRKLWGGRPSPLEMEIFKKFLR